mmetsp:Transcript_4765/g.19570  ORF Transcript_4765/g.19570 Transcript_4765/m.19570 type:complete len:234 (+) Transcript_4765:1122-1823(+)
MAPSLVKLVLRGPRVAPQRVVLLPHLNVEHQVHPAAEHLLQHGSRADANLPDDAAPRSHHDLLHGHAVDHERLLDAVAPVVEVGPTVVHGHDGVGQLLVQPPIHRLPHNLDRLVDHALIRHRARGQIPRPTRRPQQQMRQQHVRPFPLGGADRKYILKRVHRREGPSDALERLPVLRAPEEVHLVQRQHRGRHGQPGHLRVLEPLEVGARGREQVHDARVRAPRLPVGVDDEE